MLQIPEIIKYVKRPVLRTEREKFTPNHLRELVTLSVILAIAIGMVVGIFLAIIGVENPADSKDFFSRKPTLRDLLIIIVLAPIIEEIFFRSWLGHKNSVVYLFPVFLLIVFGFGLVFVNPPALQTYIWISIFALGIYVFRLLQNGFQQIHNNLAGRNFPYVFWTSSILFGLVHIGNFSTAFAAPVLVLMVLPQTIAGFILGYTRMRFGVLACILLHGFYNGTITVMSNFLS